MSFGTSFVDGAGVNGAIFLFFSILTRIRMTYFFWVIVGVFTSGFLSHFSVLAHVHVD